MLTFDTFRADESVGIPIYLQILRYIKQGIARGEVIDGDALPSRRVLSALLGVNPMTIQKTYRILEEEGLIVSHTGAKSLISLNAETLARVRHELLDGDALAAAAGLKHAGLSLAEAKAFLDAHWEEL